MSDSRQHLSLKSWLAVAKNLSSLNLWIMGTIMSAIMIMRAATEKVNQIAIFQVYLLNDPILSVRYIGS